MLTRLVVALVLSLCSLFAKTDWVRARSENFEFYGACGRDAAIQLLGHLEDIHQVYSELFARPDRKARILVIYCKEESDYKPFMKRFEGKRVDTGGLFFGPRDYPAIVFQRGGGDLSARRTIYQGMALVYMSFLNKEHPAFIEHGLAQLFLTVSIHGDGYTYGRDVPEYVQHLTRKGLLPLRDLLAVTTESETYNKGKARETFYAQSWAFAHMCFFGSEGSLKSKYLDYLQRQSQGGEPTLDLERAFGKTSAELDALLAEYIKNGRYRAKSSVWATPHSTEAFIVPFVEKDWEAFRCGVLHRVHQDETTKQAALAAYAQLADSKNGMACAVAGLHARDLNQPELSQTLIERALALNSDHPRLVIDKVDKAFSSLPRTLSYRMPEELAVQLRACVDQALELHPGNPELLRHLAYVEAFAPKLRVEKLEQLERQSLRPGCSEDILVLLAYIRWRHNDAKTAKVLLDKLGTLPQGSPSHAMIAELHQYLSQGLPWKKVL